MVYYRSMSSESESVIAQYLEDDQLRETLGYFFPTILCGQHPTLLTGILNDQRASKLVVVTKDQQQVGWLVVQQLQKDNSRLMGIELKRQQLSNGTRVIFGAARNIGDENDGVMEVSPQEVSFSYTSHSPVLGGGRLMAITVHSDGENCVRLMRSSDDLWTPYFQSPVVSEPGRHVMMALPRVPEPYHWLEQQSGGGLTLQKNGDHLEGSLDTCFGQVPFWAPHIFVP